MHFGVFERKDKKAQAPRIKGEAYPYRFYTLPVEEISIDESLPGGITWSLNQERMKDKTVGSTRDMASTVVKIYRTQMTLM